MLKIIVLGLVAALVVGAIYVRVAPADETVWNNAVPPFRVTGDRTLADGFATQLDPDRYGGVAESLAKLDTIIRQTPRTKVFAGSLESRTITYITRSRVMGFPDFTTVSTPPDSPSRIVIYGRLRFGASDLGVNKARIQNWLAQLDGTLPEDTPTR